MSIRKDLTHGTFLTAATLVVMAAMALLTGCATVMDNLDLSPPKGQSVDLTTVDEYGELAFQAEHLVDTMQTVHGAAMDPCFSEGDPTTKALIGAHPSQAATIVWGIGYGAVHYGITAWLLDNGHDRIAAVWEAASVIDTAAVIDHNYSIGIRIGAPNHDDAACLNYYHGNVPSNPSNFSKH